MKQVIKGYQEMGNAVVVILDICCLKVNSVQE